MASTALVRAQETADSLRARLRSQRERLRGEGRRMLVTAGHVGVGYALGMADAKWGADALAGMNTALGVGVVSTVLSMTGVGGEDMQTAARTVGDASLAIYAYSKGFEHQTAREEESADEG